MQEAQCSISPPGWLIAAVASELIPEVERIGTFVGILGGFAAGGLSMIGLKWLVLKFENVERKKHKLPIGLAAAAAIDTLIDGAIIATGFATGQQARRSTGPCHGGRTVLPHTIGRVRIS